MRTQKHYLLLVMACMLTSANAQVAQTQPIVPNGPTRLTNSATSQTGTLLKRELRWRSAIPLDKTYDQFTPEQKAEFRAMYQSLAEGDEPPYPERGLKPLFNSLKEGHSQLRARGELNLAVTVGPDGKATKVEDLGGVGGVNALEMSNYAQSIFMMAKYKPGTCQGQPCTMQFPFRLKLK